MKVYRSRRSSFQILLGVLVPVLALLAGCGSDANTAATNTPTVQQQAQSIQNDPKIPEEEKARIQQRMQAAQRSQQASGQPKQ
jgi:outer membrane biogenesis lipoprotein LolB